MIARTIPHSGETLPAIGLGTWQTFDVRDTRPIAPVLDAFVGAGGRVVDSSPMYGRSEEVVGELRGNRNLFIATKVWTSGKAKGVEQMERSMRLLRATQIDLMQIHNLVDWRTHLETLRRWKREGRIRYIGITHYQTSAFHDLESIMKAEEIDFVQLPMSIELPDAEERLLPLAEERGIAVLVNRPLEGGALMKRVRKTPPPAGFDTWSDVFLRYVISHPAVTCAIPATSSVEHLAENMRAGEKPLLSMEERRELRQVLMRD